MKRLSITERQLRALFNSVRLENSVGAKLALSNDEHLTRDEMEDLTRRLRDAVEPLEEADVSVEASETLVYFIDGKRATDVASERLDKLEVPHSVQRWQDRVYRIEVPASYEAKVAEVLR